MRFRFVSKRLHDFAYGNTGNFYDGVMLLHLHLEVYLIPMHNNCMVYTPKGFLSVC